MPGPFNDILFFVDPAFLQWVIIPLLVVLLLVAIFYPHIEKRFARRERIKASVVGFFPNVEDAVKSVQELRRARFAGEDLTVLSSIPYPEGAFETDVGRSWISYFAFTGGILGALFGIFLVVGTSIAYVLPTGGKPIVPIPTLLIITYELAVLAVMLFTLFRFLFEARLPGYTGRLYDSRISEGMIGVIARCETEEQARQAEQTLSSHGAQDTRQVEGRVT